ncbi:MAG TPA: threonine--tRNA ligase [Dehalococcoidia bacterium]|nr:threonine--tRNA ligase [Dehalococcoidia bacterium]
MAEPISEEEHSHDFLDIMRHSMAHIMAEAVLSLFPDAKFGIGPTTEHGFYYDIDLPRPLTPEDLESIDKKMRERIAQDVPFTYEDVAKDAARKLFAGQPYKLEIIDAIADEKVRIYTQGSFTDLCRGPHVPSTGVVKSFKLLNVAGAYWRGDEKRPMLQRIYGAAFESEAELEEHLHRLEEAQRRDHRRLGRELDLFSMHEEAGAGLIYWHPKGARVRNIIEEYWRQEHYKRDYDLVFSPHVGKSWLWETSGHLGFFTESMYAPMEMDEQHYYMKPMNCPFHIMIYRTALRSYRELPMRLGELGTVYRYERPGVLHGLLRVRGFTQDDAHIFCAPEQVGDEVIGVLDFTFDMMRDFGFQEFEIYLSTRPGKAVGEPSDWERAENALRNAIQQRGLSYHVDEGGGAFYGPKIDIKIKDALGREWQCATVQFDFNMPARFQLTYVGPDGREHQPYMVHRVLLGSLERFFGVLIEHYAGAFPVWLAPVQAVVIPIADRHAEYARQVVAQLKAAEVRVQVDERAERMNYKIREAQVLKVPYMLIVGDREASESTLSVRLRDGQELRGQSPTEFIRMVQEAVASKR